MTPLQRLSPVPEYKKRDGGRGGREDTATVPYGQLHVYIHLQCVLCWVILVGSLSLGTHVYQLETFCICKSDSSQPAELFW